VECLGNKAIETVPPELPTSVEDPTLNPSIALGNTIGEEKTQSSLPTRPKIDAQKMVIGAQKGPTSARKRGPPGFRGTRFRPIS
jgi:hypothetical protein